MICSCSNKTEFTLLLLHGCLIKYNVSSIHSLLSCTLRFINWQLTSRHRFPSESIFLTPVGLFEQDDHISDYIKSTLSLLKNNSKFMHFTGSFQVNLILIRKYFYSTTISFRCSEMEFGFLQCALWNFKEHVYNSPHAFSQQLSTSVFGHLNKIQKNFLIICDDSPADLHGPHALQSQFTFGTH